MQFKNFEIHASPFTTNVYCPKHGDEMLELDNGWTSKCWYCEECKYPYTLALVKIRHVNQENLEKLLKEKEEESL